MQFEETTTKRRSDCKDMKGIEGMQSKIDKIIPKVSVYK